MSRTPALLITSDIDQADRIGIGCATPRLRAWDGLKFGLAAARDSDLRKIRLDPVPAWSGQP
jgi:hypothetical protein